MVRKETWKNADYPNRIPSWAKNPPSQYRAFNKLDTDMYNKFSCSTIDENHIKSVIKGLKKTGNKVITSSGFICGFADAWGCERLCVECKLKKIENDKN